jgi:hypothetical protein
MSKPYILNPYERAALLALSQDAIIPAHSEANRGFGRAQLDGLVRLGLAIYVPRKAGQRHNGVQITDDGWRCMYGLTRAEIESHTDVRPAPFRIWQWPPPAVLQKAA